MLKIIYSHKKELQIAEIYTKVVKKRGLKVTNIENPAGEKQVKSAIQKISKVWEPKEEDFIKKLNWFYNCDFEIKGWTAYLSRFPIYPYWPKGKWFSTPFEKTDKQLQIIGHELFHQPFHLYWQDKCEGIFANVRNPKNAKENLVVKGLKEALPELLNTPDFKLSNCKDRGHAEPCEQFFRHLIRKYYKNNGYFKFEQFLQEIC